MNDKEIENLYKRFSLEHIKFLINEKKNFDEVECDSLFHEYIKKRDDKYNADQINKFLKK